MPPPHPDFVDEYRRTRRRRLRKSRQGEYFGSVQANLELLAPELCEDLSYDDCRRLDRRFLDHAKKTKEIMIKSGTVKTLVICVKFSDHIDRRLPSQNDIDMLWNAKEGEAVDKVPTGSVSEFLRRNSYGKMNLIANVKDWIVTDQTEDYYSYNKSGLTRRFANALYPALRVIDALGEDFSQYDQDGDGVLDSVVLLHSGFPAEIGGFDCYSRRDHQNRIWSHAVSSFDNKWTSFDGKYSLGGYMVASALRNTCGDQLARIGVMTHEFIHTWGVPDLYDTGGDWIGKGLGIYDIMSNPYGIDGKQTHPSSMGPWTKMQSGWLEPIEIKQNGEYIIEASAINPSVFLIKDGFPDGEYILIENRQPINWDRHLWNGGLLIWHIDEKAENMKKRGYPGQYEWPGNCKHYRVAVAQADRNYDLEKGINDGDQSDFWAKDQQLSPGPHELVATNYSQYPNTNSYTCERIFPTGIRIYDISISGLVMAFKVLGIAPAAPPTEKPSWSPTPPPTPLPTWTPTEAPTRKETSSSPTLESEIPSYSPTSEHTLNPSDTFSHLPSVSPTEELSANPSLERSLQPTMTPTSSPTYSTDSPIALLITPSPTKRKYSRPTFKPTFETHPDISIFQPNEVIVIAEPSLPPTRKPNRLPIQPSLQDVAIGHPSLGPESPGKINTSLISSASSSCIGIIAMVCFSFCLFVALQQ